MIARTLGPHLRHAASQSPVVVLTGPRQSGKTTLSRACFPDHEYVNLERLDVREFAETDPKGFLAQHAGPVILDEAQLVPGLFSYLQAKVDDDPTPGRFVLVGSHFGLIKTIGQSLAGRAATLTLLPLSLEEARRFPAETGSLSAEGGRASTDDLWTTVWTGGYPRIHDQQLPAAEWLADYAEAYVQRDVRQAFRATHLPRFVSFMRLAAGRAARELNLSSLGLDVGVAPPTIRVWLSLLEAGFLVFRAPPWQPRLRKRFVKTPKLYFVDSGLACHLLGIREPDQLRVHPLRGALFESWCASEIIKARAHRGEANSLFHFREIRGLKLALVVETARHAIAVETMSGATVMFGFPRPLDPFPEHANPPLVARHPHRARRQRPAPQSGRDGSRPLVGHSGRAVGLSDQEVATVRPHLSGHGRIARTKAMGTDLESTSVRGSPSDRSSPGSAS